MTRLLVRLVIPAVVIGIGWIAYQVADVTDCSGPQANAWATATMARLDTASADYDSWNEATPSSQFVTLAGRAEKRYHSQLSQGFPSCLDALNTTSADFFYSEWKMYEAASNDSYELAMRYEEDMFRAMEAALREIDRLAVKYDWDIK